MVCVLWVQVLFLWILFGIKTIRFNYVSESLHKSYEMVQISKILFRYFRKVVIESLNFALKTYDEKIPRTLLKWQKFCNASSRDFS